MSLLVAFALVMVLAYFIGTAMERTRAAHDRWVSYRSRAVMNLRKEMTETAHILLWVAALALLLYLFSRL
jgi:hypothetical protein